VDVVIAGDLNSYAREDPVVAARAGSDDTPGTADDYTNLIASYQGPFAYSYVFYGQTGYLDHALASTSLTPQVTGAAPWHINADEPDVVDYDTTFKPPAQDALFEPNAYRSSDHDAVVVGLNLLHYSFTGFTKLVYDNPSFNVANGGSAVPLAFGLGGFRGDAVFLDGYPYSVAISCDANATVLGPREPAATPGASALTYDPSIDAYTFVWKTEKAWDGSCRRLVVAFDDGSVHYANVRFK
jgi:hypothetical protein